MELKQLPKSKLYTQQEAREMSEILGDVYLVAHRIHCKSCATNPKYHYGVNILF